MPSPQGRLIVTSLGGNNIEEIVNGYGTSIGGNCKLITVEWPDTKTGEIKRLSVINDIGAYIPRDGEPNFYALANVLPFMKDVQAVIISHRHFDHDAGLIVIIASGAMCGKDVYAPPRVIRSLVRKLQAYPSIPRENWPRFIPVNEQCVVHFEDTDGVRRLSAALKS